MSTNFFDSILPNPDTDDQILFKYTSKSRMSIDSEYIDIYLNFYQDNQEEKFILDTTDDSQYPKFLDIDFDENIETVSSNIYVEDSDNDSNYKLIFGKAIESGSTEPLWTYNKLLEDEWTKANKNGFAQDKTEYTMYRDYT